MNGSNQEPGHIQMFPNVAVKVLDGNKVIMSYERIKPHEFSALLAIMQPTWKIEIYGENCATES